MSDPDTVRFNLSAFAMVENKTHESHIGPQVVHVYELANKGPSEILQADVYILWPTKTLSGRNNMVLSHNNYTGCFFYIHPRVFLNIFLNGLR